MQRLVYNPKVIAYIQTQEKGILDITDYIVSGNVQRVVNEVSTAELVIRNPNKRFTKPGKPTFRPMDGITIFASRFQDRPVQVFTGYLDETPYLQLFPGTCTLRASCTLKRLLYTYWDPGLPYTMGFLKKYGWVPNFQTGQIQNPGALVDQTNKNAHGDFTDGSVGNLMYAVLHEVGNWRKDQILIEEFPADAGEVVAGMVKNVSNNVDIAKEEFEKFMKDMIGQYTGGSDSVTSTPGGGAIDIPEVRDLPESLKRYNRLYEEHNAPDYSGETIPFNDIAKLAEWAGGGGVPGITMAQVTLGESGRRPGATHNDSGGTKGWGLWQITTTFHDDKVGKYGGYPGMLNPISCALVMAEIYKAAGGLGPWHGTSGVTDTNAHYTGPMN